jgi:serine-type D-Ala-D-Ala carboxypeptidase (penicillin-binding protein 5/6)
VAVVALAAPAPAAPAREAPEPAAKAWLLVDPSDDSVLASRQPGAELPMASTTKLMTAYLALRSLDLEDVATAAPYDPGPIESLMKLRPNERVSVHDLLYGLLLASGNDAAVTLAEAVAGTESAFVARMNRTARRIGLDDTSYRDPIGFDAPGHHTSARDLVDLTDDLFRDPTFGRIVDTPEIELTEGERPRHIVNRNTLVRNVKWVTGVKTGFTNDAGYVLVGSGERKGVTLISALLGAPSEAARDAGTLELLRYGFSLYRRERVVRTGERLGATEIRYSGVDVPVAAGEGVELTLRRDEDVEVLPVGVPAEIEGPIERGGRLGAAIVTVDGAREARIPLVSIRSADAASLIDRIDAALPGSRAGAWGLLGLGALAIVLVGGVVVAWARGRRSSP